MHTCVWALITALSKGDSWAPGVPQGISRNRVEYGSTYTLSRTFPDMTSLRAKHDITRKIERRRVNRERQKKLHIYTHVITRYN